MTLYPKNAHGLRESDPIADYYCAQTLERGDILCLVGSMQAATTLTSRHHKRPTVAVGATRRPRRRARRPLPLPTRARRVDGRAKRCETSVEPWCVLLRRLPIDGRVFWCAQLSALMDANAALYIGKTHRLESGMTALVGAITLPIETDSDQSRERAARRISRAGSLTAFGPGVCVVVAVGDAKAYLWRHSARTIEDLTSGNRTNLTSARDPGGERA